jgi:bacterial/archaeal transporter family-2 protein
MLYPLLAVFVGALTAIQSRLNGQLSKNIHNGVAAANISFLIGLFILSLLCIAMKNERVGVRNIWKAFRDGRLRPWEMLGGLGGGFFVSSQGITVPKLGVAIFTIATTGGQTVASLVVDKLGISPAGKKKITVPRIFAAIVTLFAVTVAVYPDISKATISIFAIILTLVVGVVIAFQQALNGRVNVVSTRPLATAFLNFFMGLLVLIVALMINLANGGTIGKLPTNIWLYAGGPIGVIFISISALTVKQMGILNFVLASVSGQLAGALLLDWLAPAAHTSISSYLVTGVAMTIGAILLGRYFESRKR